MQDALGSVQSVLVLGGGSEIGLATAEQLVRGRARTVVLAARDPARLGTAVERLTAAGATTVDAVAFDATATSTHAELVEQWWRRYGDFDVVVLAFGVLGDQEQAEHDASAAVAIVQTNFTGAVSIAVPIAARLRAQGHGTLVVLSSVAGERARRANFVYGSTKAGLDAFMQGLGDALVGSGARVMIVRPGFVHTRMTAGLEPAPFATTPEAVATAVRRGLERGSEIVWVPGALRFVMSALRHLPRPLFRRLPIS